MKAEVRTTPAADGMIHDALSWWRTNRSAAPDLLMVELTAAFQTLGIAPDAGRRWKSRRVPGVRRMLLRETRFHVYYVHAESKGIVLVLGLWSAHRGRGPKLTMP